MSSRQIRKVIGGPRVPAPENPADGDFDPYEGKSSKSGFSAFDLLEDENIEKAENMSSVSEKTESEEECIQPAVRHKKKKKKSRSKKKEISADEKELEVDRLVQEVNSMLGEPSSENKKIQFEVPRELIVQPWHLDAFIELKRKFTEKVVRAELGSSSRNRNNRVIHKTHIITPSAEWPTIRKTGLTMALLRQDNNGVKYFRFIRGTRTEESIQAIASTLPTFAAAQVIAQYRHVNAIELLILGAYHLGNAEELASASKCVDMAVYCFEKAMLSTFSLTEGNCRLEYKYPENRMFYVTLLQYVNFITNRVCHRTALEISKMLLTMEPTDPVALLLYIDVLALRASQHLWLCEAVEIWKDTRNALWLPNFPYSYSLALFKTKKDGDTSEADKMLELAMVRFPMFIPKIIEKSHIAISERIKSHKYFRDFDVKESHYLKLLIEVYAERICSLFRRPCFLPWLDKTINKFLDKLDRKDSELMKNIREAAEYRKRCFLKPPSSALRHLVILGLADVPLLMTMGIRENADVTNILDPLPPADTVGSIVKELNSSRQMRVAVPRAGMIDAGGVAAVEDPARRLFRAFVDSMFPNFVLPPSANVALEEEFIQQYELLNLDDTDEEDE